MKNKIIILIIFISVFASSFYFGLSRLSSFSGVDEPYWSYDRVPQFWDAIKTMQWKKTNLCDKPGITIAAISGIGLFFDGEDYESIKQLRKLRYDPKTKEQLQRIENLYFHLRLPVFLFTLAILPLFYFLIKKLLGWKIAAFSTIFMGLSPILLGISLIINSDATLWILSGLSSLSLFIFFKNNSKKYLIFSGFLLGLSIITKYVANILFVYFFLLFLAEFFMHAHEKLKIAEYMKKALLNYLLLFVTAMTSAFIFFPATWVKFSKLIDITIGHDVFSSTWPLFAIIIGSISLDILAFKAKFSKIIFDFIIKNRGFLLKATGAIFLTLIFLTFLHVYAKINIFPIQEIIASPKGIGSGNILQRYGGAMLADIYSLIFSISPIILFFFIFSIFSLFGKIRKADREITTIFYILIFVLMFYLGSAVNDVTTTVRYQIMTYPLVFVSAAIGISRFLKIGKICSIKSVKTEISQSKIIPQNKKNILNLVALITVFALLEISLFFIKPNFLAYASEILPNKFIVNLKGMGEGSVEAAEYLNGLPGSHEMIIWSDKGAVCERFIGKCFIDFKKETFRDNAINYFVLSTDRMSRTIKLSKGIKIVDEEKKRAKEDIGSYVNFEQMYSLENTAHEIIIGNNPNNFVKIIKTENIF